ncbi:hypothetical protein EUTSA_v10022629mg [Eutrema salsugineum]|uniref:Translation initiation factor 3 N-terminal domain-containing protein n=1 Tax=Eutrema salsugineum TaxID=72664 RepID=V4M717_EUTSA|nr:translation initiation factor IF3-1, mitochondrial [Eutrema salsugineum]ESQ50822.1 hypothetical protein EUTSA_v10022629mg [Eutrema salsugineum]
MAFWRMISRSYLKYTSNQLTRNYSQVCLATSLTHAVKQTKLCSFDIPNSDICRKPSKVFENVRFLATSAQARKKEEGVESDGPRLNEKITGDTVRLVSEEGHCVVSLREALRRAKELKQDLVEVQRDANPPVCKIVDYSHEKYKKAQAGKERAKAKRAEVTIRPEVKEIRFTPKIEAKDLQFKAKQALKLMESGYRVKCHAVPDKDKKKELEPEKLLELLSRFTCYIEDALVEFGPEADRGNAVVVVRHAKFGPPKKGKAIKLKEMNLKTAARIKDESAKSDSSETGVSSVDDEVDLETVEPDLPAKQANPVQVPNRYANREPTADFSRGRDANRFEPQSPNQPVTPQHPRFSNQQPNGRFDPQSPNQAPSEPRPRFQNQPPNQQTTGRFDPQFPNQAPNPPRSRFPDQAPNQQPSGRFDPQYPNQAPNPPRSRFPDQAPNQQPSGRFDPQYPNQAPSPLRPRFPDQAPNQQPSGPSPNRHLDRQGPPPRFQNQAPNQQPTGRFEPPPPNPPRAPPRPQTRLPNEAPNQQPTGPGRSSGPSSYGIFSTPKKN